MKKNKIVGIYHHKDLDGMCSGAIMRKKFVDIKLVGYDYNEPFDFSIVDNATVIMSDVSMSMPDMKRIAEKAVHFIWIDHHKTAIDAFHETGGGFLEAHLQIGKAACELTWEALFPDTPIPYAVTLLGEYDTWRNNDKERWGSVVMPFQYGMRLRVPGVGAFPSEALENANVPFINEVQKEGRLVLSYQDTMNTKLCERSAFVRLFHGLRAVCVNSPGANSAIFDSVYNEKDHDIMMPFYYNGTNWTVSIYTTKSAIDCGAIAKTMGGGGHAQAAGFKIEEINNLFEIEQHD